MEAVSGSGQPEDVDAVLARFLARVAEDRAGPQFLGWMTEFNGNGDPIDLEMWRDGDRTWFRPSPQRPRLDPVTFRQFMDYYRPLTGSPEPPLDPHRGELGAEQQAGDKNARQEGSNQG